MRELELLPHHDQDHLHGQREQAEVDGAKIERSRAVSCDGLEEAKREMGT